MNYSELKQIFRELKQTSPKDDLTAHVIFTEDSFTKPYPLLSRTYRVSSNNKGFRPHMFSNSIFACCLDGTDQRVRLDWYMAEEGNSDGWKVEDCYILEQMRDAAAIPKATRTEQEDGTICYFFGDTCIRVRESHEGEKIHLEPVSGDQTACGEWVNLSVDRVYGYCTLLERYLSRRGKADMRILVIEPECRPEIREIDDSLEAMQEIVGGLIQPLYPFDDPVALVCNDEGKLMDLPANRGLRNEGGQIYDIVCGTFFLCGAPADSDHFTSLTPEQIERYQKLFYTPEMFWGMDGHIVCLPLEV